MLEFLNVTSGNRVAYHKTTGINPGIIFLGGFMSDMDGSKALFLEEYVFCFAPDMFSSVNS